MDEDWAQKWDIAGAAAYIAGRGYTTVALQFPDELLNEAAAVSTALQEACAAAGQEIQVGHGSCMGPACISVEVLGKPLTPPLCRPL